MPISSNDFEKSDRETSLVLMDFLRTNRLDAYNADELVETLASMGKKLAKEEVERRLTLLEYAGEVESKKIAGMPYYRYRDTSYFRPPTRPRW